MATLKGRAEFSRFMQQLPDEMRKVLRGAGRAGATVVADEAKARSISAEVSESVKVKVRTGDGQVIAKIQTVGPGAYLAPWLEYGTSEHFISVDDSQRQGRSIGRINLLSKEHGHSLVIGGNFVGTTVLHPGARPHPFLRPALDTKQVEALAAAQAYINARVTPAGIVGTAEPEDPE